MLIKNEVLKSIEELPEEFSFDDVLDRLLLLDKIETGLEQSYSGQAFTTASSSPRPVLLKPGYAPTYPCHCRSVSQLQRAIEAYLWQRQGRATASAPFSSIHHKFTLCHRQMTEAQILKLIMLVASAATGESLTH